MGYLLILCIILLEITVNPSAKKVKDVRGKGYIIQADKPLDEIRKNLGDGFEVTQILDGFFRVVPSGTRTKSAGNATEVDIKKVKEKVGEGNIFEDLVYQRDKRAVPQNRKQRAVSVLDAYWTEQWHLDPSHSPSMGVYDVWDDGYTGQGVTVAIVDDGIDPGHIDLVDNFDPSLSFDIIYNEANPSHVYIEEGHGTNCAGIVAAVKNEHCVIGIAYGANMPAIRLLDLVYGATASEEAAALIHELEYIDIYSNSWGPTDDGAGFDPSDGITAVQEAALLRGVTEGRDGKGAIYTWAAGNGGGVSDDCNVDGYSNRIYTISITSLGPDSAPAWYAEECTAILAAAYGGDDSQNRTIATTNPNDTCIETFQGTSAACPVASGIIALTLEANPELTWRDIQHLIVETSTNIGLADANFYSNAAGKRVSLSHGFGLLNAPEMVNTALTWLSVPNQIICEGATQDVTRSLAGITSLNSSWTSEGCSINYLEHVYVNIYFNFYYREYSEIYLVSPGGTESRILRQRPFDAEFTDVTWTFMSVHTWRENPSGIWTLRMDSWLEDNAITLFTWSLTFYGTITDPLLGTPDDGKLGGECNTSIVCTDPNTGCNETLNLCVTCNDNHHAIGGLCIEDGTQGGFCDDTSNCTTSSLQCVDDICQTGPDDGTLGGACSTSIECTDPNTGCNETLNVCVTCNDNHHAIGGLCIEDGTQGGFCDDTSNCTTSSLQCVDNTCQTEEEEEEEEGEEGGSNNTGAIVGGTIGAVAGAAALTGVGVILAKTLMTSAAVNPAATATAHGGAAVQAVQGPLNEAYAPTLPT